MYIGIRKIAGSLLFFCGMTYAGHEGSITFIGEIINVPCLTTMEANDYLLEYKKNLNIYPNKSLRIKFNNSKNQEVKINIAYKHYGFLDDGIKNIVVVYY